MGFIFTETAMFGKCGRRRQWLGLEINPILHDYDDIRGGGIDVRIREGQAGSKRQNAGPERLEPCIQRVSECANRESSLGLHRSGRQWNAVRVLPRKPNQLAGL